MAATYFTHQKKNDFVWLSRQTLCFAFLCNMALLVHSKVIADEAPQSYDAFDKLVEVSTESKTRYVEIAGSYRVEANAGHLPANQFGIVRVRINNVEDFDLPIAKVTASCGCTKAKLLDNRISANGHADLVIKVKTPDRGPTGDFVGQIRLHIDQPKAQHKLISVDVALKYRIDDLLCFPESLVPVSVDGDKATQLELPIVCTVKTPLDQLTVDATEAFQGLEGKILSMGDGKAKLSLLIDPTDASTRGLFGKVTITDPVSQASDTVSIILYRQETVTISPRTLRFSSGEEDSEILTAHAVVRVRASEKETENSRDDKEDAGERDSQNQQTKTIHGEAYLDGVQLNVKLTPMIGQISRATFSLTQKQWQALQDDNRSDFHVNWTIVANRKRTAGKALAIFLSR